MLLKRSGPGPLRARLRYCFDNALSRGPLVVIAYLALLTLTVVVVAGGGAALLGLTFGGSGEGFGESAYQALLRMLDPGTFSDDAGWGLRSLGLLVTLVGIVLGGALIGLIANDVDQRVDALRRGRGRVLECDHTLVLGWSSHVPQLVSELVLANASRRRASVVVLADADKLEMEETLRAAIADTQSTRVVVRSGNPALPSDLERVCARAARSIVVVRGVDGDAGVIKAVLAIRALDPLHSACHVVAELDNEDDARTLRVVSMGRVVTVSSESVVAEVTAQACHQSGLAAVFQELLTFAGQEFYFVSAHEVAGWTYAAAQLGYETASVVGRITAHGRVDLAPPPDTLLAGDDRLVVVAEDDGDISFTGGRPLEPVQLGPHTEDVRRPVRVLIVGWSHFGERVLSEIDEFLLPSSQIHVLVDRDLVVTTDVSSADLQNATLTVSGGGGGPEDLLSLRTDQFDQVVLLAYRDALSPSDADARTLLSLLALRMVWPVSVEPHVRVVAELTDPRNVSIAEPAGIDDLIISDALASMMVAQLSERPELREVFGELFDPSGAAVVMIPVEPLLASPPGTYADLVASVGRSGASAFGYRYGTGGKVVLNPPKSAGVELRSGDHVVAVRTRAALRAARSSGSQPATGPVSGSRSSDG